MRLVFISDTHGKHDQVQLPPGDMLIHTGDFSKRGRYEEVAEFMDWYGGLEGFPYKILVAGNHDFLAEREPRVFRSLLPPTVTYLEDSGTVLEGIRIWGSPVQPTFHDWAFNRNRGAAIRRYWDIIPAELDLLLLHGPPYGILDQVVPYYQNVGCEDLLEAIRRRRPRSVAFGHIHEAYGMTERDGTLFLNAACLDEQYQIAHRPIVVEWTETAAEVIEIGRI